MPARDRYHSRTQRHTALASPPQGLGRVRIAQPHTVRPGGGLRLLGAPRDRLALG